MANFPREIWTNILRADNLTQQDISQVAVLNRNLNALVTPILNTPVLIINLGTSTRRLLDQLVHTGHTYQVIEIQGVSDISDYIPFRDRGHFQTLLERCPNVRTIRLRRINPLYALRTLGNLQARCEHLRNIEVDWYSCVTTPTIMAAYFNAVMNHRNTIDTMILPHSAEIPVQMVALHDLMRFRVLPPLPRRRRRRV